MTTTLDEVVAAGKTLDPDQREIAALLIAEDDETDANEQAAIDAAWRDTIARRLNDLETGRVQPVSGRETSAIVDAMIRDWPE